MSRAVAFEKWEGLGNDFVVVGARDVDVTPELARALCDRHFGVGADGVLVVAGDPARPRMIVYNADGSRPEMCGNGLRCVVGHLAAAGPIEGGAVTVATDAGDRRCEVRGGGERFDVTVAMGVARAGADLVVALDGREHRFLTVDVGNPHAITFLPYDEATIDVVGPAVATTPPGGTNVEFCRLETRAGGPVIAVTVWERGVGRTLACGTGACAVAAAACATGRAAYDAPIRVALPGGELEITVAAGSGALAMRGPARRVYRGAVVLA